MQRPPSGEVWERTVEVNMAGPGLLAVEATDSYYCGGPYPNDGMRSAFVFDLATGRPVDWLALFPRGATAKRDTSADGATIGLVVWPELTRRARTQADADCKDAFDDDENDGFLVWPDARTGELVAEPAEFPHVIHACADEVRLSAVDLRRLGFASPLIAALENAHHMQGREINAQSRQGRPRS